MTSDLNRTIQDQNPEKANIPKGNFENKNRASQIGLLSRRLGECAPGRFSKAAAGSRLHCECRENSEQIQLFIG